MVSSFFKPISVLLLLSFLGIVAKAQLSFDHSFLSEKLIDQHKYKLLDLDSDGDLDIFTGGYFLTNEKGSYVFDTLIVYEEQPYGKINYLNYTNLTRNGIYSVLDLEDSNGDGIFELFTIVKNQKRIEVKVNYKKTKEFFDSGLSFEGYDKLALYDADNDGYKDFVLGNQEEMVIYQNAKFSNRQYPLIYRHRYEGASKLAGTGELVVADFNLDGELDIFNGNTFFYKKPFEKSAKIFDISAPLTFQNIPFSIQHIQVADVGNAAFPSLMGQIHFNADKVPFKSFVLNRTDSLFEQYNYQNAADLDNDGLLDFIYSTNNQFYYKTATVTGKLDQSLPFKIDAIKYIGDLDQNGFLDFIVMSKNIIYLLKQKNIPENTAPTSPEINLSLVDNMLEISWMPSVDTETAHKLLQYNLSISTTNDIGASFLESPVIHSEIVTRQDESYYQQTPANHANVGYPLSKKLLLNFEAQEVTITLSAIDNKGRISAPQPLTIDLDFLPYSLTNAPWQLGTKETRFELTTADLDTNGTMDFLVQNKNAPDSLYGYFQNTWKPATKRAKGQAKTEIADLDNNGQLDIVSQDAKNNMNYISYNFQTENFQNRPFQYPNNSLAFKYLYDEDTDGDLDLFIAPHDSIDLLGTSFYLLRAKDSRFEAPIATDKLVLHSSDFDNDGENDLLILKPFKDTYSISLLLKKGRKYPEIQNQIHTFNGKTKHLSSIQIERFDLNGDGVFELVIQEKEASVCVVFEQNIAGGFSPTKTFANSNFVFLDYNNDGLIDLFELNNTGIYKNNGEFNFSNNKNNTTLSRNISFDLLSDKANNYKPTLAVDFDNDSLTDFVSVDDAGLLFFKNNLSVDKNKAPSIPTKLKAETFEDTVALSWQKSIDNGTSAGLSYNIQVWKKETNQHLTPIHSLSDGRLILNEKYTSISNKHVFRQLTDGTYYWKVQAIDAGNLPSAFSEIGSFEVVIKPTISGNKTACNHDIATFSVSPRSEHYTWQVAGGTIVDSSDGTIKVKWYESGFQQVKIRNTKFQLSDSTKIEVKNNPIPTISYHFPDSNSVLKLLFKTNYSDSVKTSNWNINESLYSEATPTHLFSLPGKYATKVEVEYKNGCKINENKFIDLFYPKIEGKKAVCGTSEETYTANPKGPAYKWEVVGGLILSNSNESIKVKWEESTQAKSVTLINPTYQYADSIKVHVFPVPIADFEVPENIGIGSLIQFQNTSTGSISTYLWDFDEPENTATTKNPTVNFVNSGQHKINLTLRNIEGCEASKNKTIIVSDEISPILITNLLTPNSDGKNDQLFIENLERYPENEVKLYTAWGSEIFSQSNYQNDWDLRKSDEYIPPGNYLCVVELKKFGKRFEKIVTVTR